MARAPSRDAPTPPLPTSTRRRPSTTAPVWAPAAYCATATAGQTHSSHQPSMRASFPRDAWIKRRPTTTHRRRVTAAAPTSSVAAPTRLPTTTCRRRRPSFSQQTASTPARVARLRRGHSITTLVQASSTAVYTSSWGVPTPAHPTMRPAPTQTTARARTTSPAVRTRQRSTTTRAQPSRPAV